ncbi:MAG: alpha/beta hydrolase [Myxococcota bacterium]|nr:alpha/beta hydrolase [Myxococcota bacterium]
MDAEVRFVRNSAGERIAYAVHGKGSPLVCVAWWVSHLESDWEHPGYRRFFAELGEQHTVVRYDRPGTGLSDRQRTTVDLESEVATLEAIVDGLGLGEMSLLGIACGGPTAVAYAARHPERVTKLVAFGSYVRGSDIGPRGARDAVQALVRESWGLGSKTVADLFAPELDAEERRILGRAQRAAASADMASRLLALTFDVDVETEAREVSIPALVLHRKGDRTIPFAAGCELAACLPGARLRSLEGKAHPPWYGDVTAASRAVLDFLGNVERAPARPPGPMAHELRREGVLWHFSFDGKEICRPREGWRTCRCCSRTRARKYTRPCCGTAAGPNGRRSRGRIRCSTMSRWPPTRGDWPGCRRRSPRPNSDN